MLEDFILHVLGDVCERITQNGEILARGRRREEQLNGGVGRVALRGYHMNLGGGNGFNYSFRGSDASLRLTLAVTAAEETRGGIRSFANACADVAVLLEKAEFCRPDCNCRQCGALPKCGCSRVNKQGSRRHDPKRLSRHFGARDGHLIDSIRRQVYLFRRRNPEWSQLFHQRVEMFRCAHPDANFPGELEQKLEVQMRE